MTGRARLVAGVAIAAIAKGDAAGNLTGTIPRKEDEKSAFAKPKRPAKGGTA